MSDFKFIYAMDKLTYCKINGEITPTTAVSEILVFTLLKEQVITTI